MNNPDHQGEHTSLISPRPLVPHSPLDPWALSQPPLLGAPWSPHLLQPHLSYSLTLCPLGFGSLPCILNACSGALKASSCINLSIPDAGGSALRPRPRVLLKAPTLAEMEEMTTSEVRVGPDCRPMAGGGGSSVSDAGQVLLLSGTRFHTGSSQGTYLCQELCQELRGLTWGVGRIAEQSLLGGNATSHWYPLRMGDGGSSQAVESLRCSM